MVIICSVERKTTLKNIKFQYLHIKTVQKSHNMNNHNYKKNYEFMSSTFTQHIMLEI